jgi:hypothetical protein
LIAIDGKTLRGSRAKTRGPLHLVNVWAASNRLVLAQRAVADKSNEITAVPQLLRTLELTGCLVTVDALPRQLAQHFPELGESRAELSSIAVVDDYDFP